MRISTAQVQSIVSICTSRLSYTPEIWLFGSRLLDETRGGDFDLLVEVRTKLPLIEELHMQQALATALDREVDLLVSTQGQACGPWQRLAKTQGVRLHATA